LTDDTVDRRVDLSEKETKKEKPMIGKRIVCTLCGHGEGTLQKDGRGEYVHQQKPCPKKKVED
jgi:hypothetical protein